MLSTSRTTHVLLAVALSGSLLAACGGDGEDQANAAGGGDVTLDAGSTLTAGAISAGGDAALAAGSDLTSGAIEAGGSVALTAGGTVEAGDIVVALDAPAHRAKASAARAYTSQLGFQFGGAAAMDERLGRIWSERLRSPI